MKNSFWIVALVGFLVSACSEPMAPELEFAEDRDSISAWQDDFGHSGGGALPRQPSRPAPSGSCAASSPHYKLISGQCVPSCGVVLNGRTGVMAAGSCSSGTSYAGLSWEEVQYGSKCCVASSATAPTPPRPVGGSGNCRPQPKADGQYTCNNSGKDSQYFNDTQWAIDEAARRAPHMVNLNDTIFEGAFKVHEPSGPFFELVARILEERGYCAFWDGEEIGVKRGESFNAQIDPITADSYIRRGGASYLGNCFPAWF